MDFELVGSILIATKYVSTKRSPVRCRWSSKSSDSACLSVKVLIVVSLANRNSDAILELKSPQEAQIATICEQPTNHGPNAFARSDSGSVSFFLLKNGNKVLISGVSGKLLDPFFVVMRPVFVVIRTCARRPKQSSREMKSAKGVR